MRPMLEGATCALIRKMLGVRPCTSFDVEGQLRVSLRSANRNLQALHAAKEAHITRWWRGGGFGPWVPVYAAGPGRDAAKPKPITDKERARIRRKCPVHRMNSLMYLRAYRLRKKAELRRTS